MKTFVCVVLLAAAAVAAPEGKRDKRGFLHSDIGLSSGLSSSHGLEQLSLSHAPLSLGHSSYSHGLDLGHQELSLGQGLSYGSYGHGSGYLDHAPIIHAAPAAKIISVNKVVEIPKVIEIKKIVSVPKVVSVPQIIKVNKIVHEPTLSLSSHNSGWW